LKRTIIVLLLLCSTAPAQTVADALHKGATQREVFADFGNGVGKRSSTHIFFAGGRWGWILTHDHLGGPLRGNLEYAVDVIPLFAVAQPVANAYGGGFDPFILKWNFTSAKRVAPYLEFGGGVLFTNNDVPPNTNNVNFTPQAGLGIHILRGENHALTFSVKYMHVSNAKLATNNAGLNATVQFLLGYTWFK